MGIGTWLYNTFGPITEVVDVPDVRVQRSEVMDLRTQAPGGIIVPKWQQNKPQYLSNDVVSFDREGFRKSPLIFRAAKYVGDAASAAPLRVYKERGTQLKELPKHPFRDLMQRPNPQQGEAQFIALCVLIMQLAGYVVIEKERDRLGNVIGLWPLRPDWLRPKPRDGGAPDWEYRVPGYDQPFQLKAEDVITQTYQDTMDRKPTGIGPLEVALREVGVANSLTDFLKAFLDRGAMPLYFAIPSDDPDIQALWTDQARADAFRAKFRERYGGTDNALDIGIFGGIKDIKPLGLNFDELAFPQLKDLTDNAICTAFGVSPILLDAKAGLANSTYNNKVEARRGFFEDTMTFLWARLDDAFTRHLLLRHGLLFTLADSRVLPRPPRWSRALPATVRRKMYKSADLPAERIDSLYSELVCVPW